MKPSPKKILIVAHHYPPHITGVGMVAHNQAKRLVQLGYPVTVITSNTGPDEKDTVVDGVNVLRVKALNFTEDRWNAPFPIFSPSLFFILRKQVKNADIVHIHDAFYISSFTAALWARFYKKPIVLTQHVAMIAHPSRIIVNIQRVVYATTGHIIFRLCNTILVYNDQVEHFLTKRGFKEKIKNLQNGVDTELFHPMAPEKRAQLKQKFGVAMNKKILLFVGRFVPKKGFDKVIGIRNPDYQIICTGGIAPAEKYDNVLFLGKLDQTKLAQLYQLADIFILPSESEGFPLSIQEAMASGLPVITTKDVGYSQYKFDDKLICFIEHPTTLLLEQAIEGLLKDTQRLHAMSEYGEKYALSHFSWPAIITQLESVYSSLPVPRRRIAFVSDAVYPFNKGGKEKRIFDITRRLSAQGYEVTIYCMNWWKGAKVIEREGLTFHAISPYYELYFGTRRSIKEAIFFALNCFKLLGEDFDFIEVDHIPHPVVFTMKLVCLLKRKRMVVTWHEVWGKKYWKEYVGPMGLYGYWVEKISARLPDTIISVSDHTTKALGNILDRKKNVITIPNGLDIDEIASNAAGSNGADIMYAGRLLSHKNIDVLLHAMKNLLMSKPHLSLMIVGEGPERIPLETLARNLGIERNVIFHDFFEDHRELYRTMKSSRVFVLPSSREGFGIVVLEANACGLPVVTVDHPENAAKDLIIEGGNGVVSKLDDVHLARAIETALELKNTRSDFRPWIDKYNWNNIISEIETVYS